MAHSNSSPTTRRLVGPFAYRHLVAATAGLTFLTILLGVSTKATGAGLACNANWPLCDGGLLDLFPASMPSFVEWFHRLVAMVTGFFIVGTTVGAWRGYAGDARVRYAATLGLVLLPIQVLLGRQTVFTYTPLVQSAHYWTAMAIFGSFVAATALVWRHLATPVRLRYALGLAVAMVPVQVLFGPQVVVRYSVPVRATHYAVTLLLLGALLAAAIAGWRSFGRVARAALALALVLVPVQVLFARQMITNFSELARLAHLAVTLALFLALVAAFVRLVRSQARPVPA